MSSDEVHVVLGALADADHSHESDEPGHNESGPGVDP
jgi:hypothetical protein